MEINPKQINTIFTYFEKNYKTITDFNKDIAEYKEEELNDNKETPKYFKDQWGVLVSYQDNLIEYGRSKCPKPENYVKHKFRRTYTYSITNVKTGEVVKEFTRREEGSTLEPEKIKFNSGLYSLNFVDHGKDVEVVAQFGGADGRIEKVQLKSE